MDEEEWTDKECDCPTLTVEVVVLALRAQELQALLVPRKRPPFEGMWSIPRGLVGADEALEAAAARKLVEETRLSAVFLEQLYTFGEPRRDPRGRVIAVAYLALVSAAAAVQGAAIRGSGARWWSTRHLPPLAFDHGRVLACALSCLRHKLESTAIGLELLPDEFTLPELQTAYETVLGEALDRRNFRRKVLETGLIEPSGRIRSGGGRPARLYRYREDAVAEVKGRWRFP